MYHYYAEDFLHCQHLASASLANHKLALYHTLVKQNVVGTITSPKHVICALQLHLHKTFKYVARRQMAPLPPQSDYHLDAN